MKYVEQNWCRVFKTYIFIEISTISPRNDFTEKNGHHLRNFRYMSLGKTGIIISIWHTYISMARYTWKITNTVIDSTKLFAGFSKKKILSYVSKVLWMLLCMMANVFREIIWHVARYVVLSNLPKRRYVSKVFMVSTIFFMYIVKKTARNPKKKYVLIYSRLTRDVSKTHFTTLLHPDTKYTPPVFWGKQYNLTKNK